MPTMRIHRYLVDDAILAEFLSARAALIAEIRAGYPGLDQTVLARQEDGGYTDTWLWDSEERMANAFPVMGSPAARAVLSLTTDGTAANAELVDRR